MLTEEEIEAANTIIKVFNMNPRSISSDLSVKVPHIRRMARYLRDDGLISFTEGAHSGIIYLTPKGERLQKSGKNYADYLEEQQEHVKGIEDNIYFVFCFFPVIIVTCYFVNVNLNWNGLILFEPLTWINTENFGKTEILIMATEVFLVVFCTWLYKKTRRPFRTFLSLILKTKNNDPHPR